jgi:acyl-CoA thioester hydrolase
MKPELSHEIEVTPAFYEIDVMEIVWHGHYVKYLERARSALLSSFGYDYPQMRASGYAWPIVDMRLKYVRSAVFGRPVKVRATIVEWENRLKIDYLMRDAQTGRKLNQATTVQVAINMITGEMCFASPQVLLDKLGVTAC